MLVVSWPTGRPSAIVGGKALGLAYLTTLLRIVR